jgi:hypothetical protein
MAQPNIQAIFYSSASPYAAAVNTPAHLMETHGLLVAFIALDPESHAIPAPEILEAFHSIQRTLPADSIHPAIILGSLGFTIEFFERLRGRTVAVVAKEFVPNVEDGLRNAGADIVRADQNPSVVITDKSGLAALQQRRGTRELVELGCEFWMYGPTVPPLSSDCWLPTQVLEPRGGRILMEPSWLLADPERAIALAKRVRSSPGWSAYITVQTLFLLGRIKSQDSHSDWSLKLAAAEAMSIVHFVDVLFPLPQPGQAAQRLEGMQEWSMKRTMHERLQVANRFIHIGNHFGRSSELAGWTSPGQVEVRRVDNLAEQDLVRRRAQPITSDFKRLIAVGTDIKPRNSGLPVLDLETVSALLES